MPPQIATARPGAGRGAGSHSSGFRGTGAFKPPRPVAGAAAARPAGSTTTTKRSAQARPPVDIEPSDEDDDDDVDELERSRINSASRPRRRTLDQFQEEGEGEETGAGVGTDVATDNDDDDNDGDEDDASEPGKTLPPALLARLLHHFFRNPNGATTRLTQDAHAAVNKYIEIFIREAVARSVAERGNGAFLDVGCFSLQEELGAYADLGGRSTCCRKWQAN